MTRYRMRVFKPGHPEPELWQTHDIFAPDDVTAKTLATEQYDQLAAELAQSKADHDLVNFCLCDGERLVCETIRKDTC
jgi:hypothetical protein